MKKSKVIVVMCCCFMLIVISGCSASSMVSARLKSLDLLISKEKKENLETSKDILNCISNDDLQGLKSLLCLRNQELEDIDNQIEAGFDFFNGKVISFDEEDMSGYAGESVEDGETTFLERGWSIEKIKTDRNESYEIYVSDYYICENDETRKGISEITITNSRGEELTIGYKWPLQDNEGRDIAVEIVKNFDERDKNGLKKMLCATALETKDIDKQIKAGMEFFEGNATRGKVGTDYQGHELYDGDHAFHSVVRDNEKIENGEPVYTSIEVEVNNIETDSGRIYKIIFYANLLNIDDETSEGISKIIIANDAGEKQVIGK